MPTHNKRRHDELSKITKRRIEPDQYRSLQKSSQAPGGHPIGSVRSQNNVGSVFRTSDAFRIEKIFLCGITSTPENREVHKTALGAEDAVDWEYVKDTTEAVDRLKKEGYRIFAIEQAENTTSLENFSLSPVRNMR